MMRAVQIALLVICIQVMGGIITATGLFGGIYYETSAIPEVPNQTSAQTAEEQTALSFNIMNALWNTLTWGWIKQFFEPIYSNVAAVRAVVDAFILGLNGICWTLIGIAFIQFLRNLIKPI